MSFLKKILPLFLLLLLSYWSIKPIFIRGSFPIHDDTQVARVYEMHKSLQDGMFPVRWVTDLGYGYGYPIFNFYAPLSYYIGGAAAFFTDALAATKLMMTLGVLVAGISMYLFARELWGEGGGLIAGLLYLYAPYHAVDIYVRGDVAEFWAYSFIPLVFLSFYKIFSILKISDTQGIENAKLTTQSAKQQLKPKKVAWYWIIVGSAGYAAVILSHNLTAMITTPFLIIFAVMLFVAWKVQNTSDKALFIFLPLLFGILLSAFYWLPALAEIKYTNVTSQIGGGADYHDHFVCISQLWDSPWGYGGSTKGCVDGLSFKIGKMHLIFTLLSLGLLPVLMKKRKSAFLIAVTFFFCLLLSIFFMLEQSVFIWNMLPQMAYLQYPWRFLLLASFFTSFLSGGGYRFIEELLTKYMPLQNKLPAILLCIMMSVLIIVFNARIFTPRTIFEKTAYDYTNSQTLSWSTSRISDEYMPKGFNKPKSVNDIPHDRIAFTMEQPSAQLIVARTQSIHVYAVLPKKTNVQVNVAYFPAWHFFIDGKPVNYINRGGTLSAFIPGGAHAFDIAFIQTPMEKIGDILSLCGVCLLILGIIMVQRKTRYEFKKA